METQTDKTAVIYCRVSSQEQVQGTSLGTQEKLCREYAAQNGLEVLKVFIEEGESAKSADRTEFQKALAFCAQSKPPVDQFIVHKLDRFARNQDDHSSVRLFLKKYKTKLRSVTEHIDESAIGRMMEGMLSVMAEFDNNVRAQRSKSGMVELVKRGVWVWAAPLGYKRVEKGGNLYPDDTSAAYIRLAFTEWAKGTYSYQKLSDFLYERGFRSRTGKKLYQQSIEKIIRNPIYCGTIRAFGTEVKGNFESLITEDLFERCQPARHRKFSIGKRESNNPDFPLKKHIVCTSCHAKLTGSSSTGRAGKKYPYYHHHNQGCPLAVSHAKDDLEGRFLGYLNELSPRHAEYEALFKEIVLDVWQGNYKRLDADNARLRKEIEALEYDRQKVFTAHRNGVYDDADFLNQKNYLNGKIQEKKLLLEEKRIEEFNMENALSYCFEFVRDSARTWSHLAGSPDIRVRFQKMIFPEFLHFDGEKFGTTKMSLVYELKQSFDADSSNLVTLGGIEPPFRP